MITQVPTNVNPHQVFTLSNISISKELASDYFMYLSSIQYEETNREGESAAKVLL